jgi:hypothetical protein
MGVMPKSINFMSKHKPFVIVGAFLVFGAAWLLVSDRLLLDWVADPRRLSQYLALKGVLVLMAATLMFYLVNSVPGASS